MQTRGNAAQGGGGVRTRPWWLALLACGGAYWPLALEPSAMTSRHPHCRGHLHCRGHPPAGGGGGSRMQLLPMATSPDGLISARYAVIMKIPSLGGAHHKGGGGGSSFCDRPSLCPSCGTKPLHGMRRRRPIEAHIAGRVLPPKAITQISITQHGTCAWSGRRAAPHAPCAAGALRPPPLREQHHNPQL